MSNKFEGVKKLLGNRAFISLLCIGVVIITFSAIRARPDEIAVTEYKPAEKQEVQTSAVVNKDIQKPERAAEEMPAEEEETVKETLVYRLPLQGELQKAFSAEELVWDETMEDWRTHKGVDIAAEPGDEVDTAAPGTVTYAKADYMEGYVVKIDHGDGTETIYKNLAKSVVAVGDSLDEGQMVGTVGDTAPFEMAQKPHLHFEIISDGEYVNPLEFIK